MKIEIIDSKRSLIKIGEDHWTILTKENWRINTYCEKCKSQVKRLWGKYAVIQGHGDRFSYDETITIKGRPLCGRCLAKTGIISSEEIAFILTYLHLSEAEP